jgi:DNA polymerase-4
MRTRTIVHLDLDAFFCCVEELKRPSLRGKAFAVGGRPDQRGVVASCSYPARAKGVRSAMPMSQAVRLVPGLIVVPPSFKDYQHYSERVMHILHQITPIVEQISIDEAFLDVTGTTTPPLLLAESLQKRIYAECGLPCSIGIACNKLVAKIATGQGKAHAQHTHTPCAIEVVPPLTEAAYLAPMPITALWGVGEKTAARLKSLNISRIGDLAAVDQAVLERMLGKHGRDLWERANGVDNRPVVTEHETKSISSETTFDVDVYSLSSAEAALSGLAVTVAKRLRRDNLQGTTIRIKLRWSDFTTITRQSSVKKPVNHETEITDHAISLLRACWTGSPVRLIGVGVSNLSRVQEQLSLWGSENRVKSHTVARMLDDLRDKFGSDIIRLGKEFKPPNDS